MEFRCSTCGIRVPVPEGQSPEEVACPACGTLVLFGVSSGGGREFGEREPVPKAGHMTIEARAAEAIAVQPTVLGSGLTSRAARPSRIPLSKRAVAAVVLGAIGFIPPLGVVALLLGLSAWMAIRRAGGARLGGRGLAATGLMLGGIFTLANLGYIPVGVFTLDRARLRTCKANLEDVLAAVREFEELKGEPVYHLAELAELADADLDRLAGCPAASSKHVWDHYRLVPPWLDGPQGGRAYESRSRHDGVRVVSDGYESIAIDEAEFEVWERVLDADRFLLLAREREAAGDWSGTVAELEQAIFLAPDRWKTYLDLVRAYEAEGEPQHALVVFRALDGYSGGATVWTMLGRCLALEAAGDTSEAWAWLDRAQALPGALETPEYHLLRGQLATAQIQNPSSPDAALLVSGATSLQHFLDLAPADHPERATAWKQFRYSIGSLFEWKREERNRSRSAALTKTLLAHREIQSLLTDRVAGADRERLLGEALSGYEVALASNPADPQISLAYLEACRTVAWDREVGQDLRKRVYAQGLRLYASLLDLEDSLASSERAWLHERGALFLYLVQAWPEIPAALTGAGDASTQLESSLLDALKGMMELQGVDRFERKGVTEFEDGARIDTYSLAREVEPSFPWHELVWVVKASDERLWGVYSLTSHPSADGGRRYDLYERRLGGERIIDPYDGDRPDTEVVTARIREHVAATRAAIPPTASKIAERSGRLAIILDDVENSLAELEEGL